MSLTVVCNGYTIPLSNPPKITDNLDAICRTLEIPTYDNLDSLLGQSVELWFKGERWFFGFLRRRSISAKGDVSYLAYDPLYFFGKNPDDYYYPNMTATQAFTAICQKVGVKVGNVQHTGVVLSPKFYRGKAADHVSIDLIARTGQMTGRKFWYRFSPYVDTFGATLFERVMPGELWAFQRGVNLVDASYEESIEDTYTVVKLINRETGKIVTKVHAEFFKRFGKTTHFEEVGKDKADTMERYAEEKCAEVSKIKVKMSINGINPYGLMPQLFSGDFVYLEEEKTGLMGAYHVMNVSHEFDDSALIRLSIDLQLSPEIPPVSYEDADDKEVNKKAERGTKEGTGVQEDREYNAQVLALFDQYGIQK